MVAMRTFSPARKRVRKAASGELFGSASAARRAGQRMAMLASDTIPARPTERLGFCRYVSTEEENIRDGRDGVSFQALAGLGAGPVDWRSTRSGAMRELVIALPSMA